jgi:DNA-binding IclR family transcriptional regulator
MPATANAEKGISIEVTENGSEASERDKTQVQVIARAAAILRTLVEDDAGLSLSQIAQRTGLARSTAQRIVAALQAEKLVIAASSYGRVILGPEILRLARAARSDIVQVAHPVLVQLSAELCETVDLSVVVKDRLLFVDQVIGPHRLRTVSAVGDTFPLYCTANGKAYLATLDDRSVELLVGNQLDARTPHTLTKLPDLLKDLVRVRKTGLAFDREEHTLGISAVGVGLLDAVGHPMAISVPVPTQRFAEMETLICERLLTTKHALQELIQQHGAYSEQHIGTAVQTTISPASSKVVRDPTERQRKNLKQSKSASRHARIV